MSIVIKIFLFFIITAGLAYVSRGALKSPRSHGFPRFFAWVFMTILLLLNIEHWFKSPFAWYQIISWLFLSTSLVLLIPGTLHLLDRGKPVRKRESEQQIFPFENTTRLVTNGIYHYIRHPLYSSLLFLTWGIYFKHLTAAGSFLTLTANLLIFATARVDEQECIRYFGQPYLDYMEKSKRFVPFVF